VDPRACGMSCKAVVQSLLLHCCKMWVVAPRVPEVLEGLHHMVAHQLSSMRLGVAHHLMKPCRRLASAVWSTVLVSGRMCWLTALLRAPFWSSAFGQRDSPALPGVCSGGAKQGWQKAPAGIWWSGPGEPGGASVGVWQPIVNKHQQTGGSWQAKLQSPASCCVQSQQ